MMTMTEQMIVFTPTVTALELKGFAEGVQALAEQIEAVQAEDVTKEQRVVAEQAALALLRNSPIAHVSLRRLERFAQDVVDMSTSRRDDIMTSMFGPDTE
jgi:hypothetical protein